MMFKNKIYLLLFSLGIGIGLLFGLNKAKASDPERETSRGVKTVFYDEYWQATEAIVSTENGYQYFNIDPLTHNPTDVAAKLENTSSGWKIKLFPKMVVTKWKVHGHIHFP